MALVASIQMNSSDSVEANIAKTEDLVSQSAALGAKMVCLPENFALMGKKDNDKLLIAEALDRGPIQTRMKAIAKQYKIWIVGGTLPITSSDPNRVYATTLVWDDTGKTVGYYHKIHMFDVKLRPGIEEYQESNTLHPGDKIQCLDSPIGKIGLSICYDLRFPELYRLLMKQGAQILMVSAAFTQLTGQPHWEILLRARAIENQCYVVASAQVGLHSSGRQTFGHSMIVDPWGAIVAEEREGEGILMAEINLKYLNEIREKLPACKHRVLN